MTGTLRDLVTSSLALMDGPVLVYFLLINTSYLALIVLASLDLARHLREVPFSGREDTRTGRLTPPVSVIMPAYDEEVGIVEAVRAMLALRYPHLEVVVVDDGSRDGTYEVLRAAYDLVEVPRVIPDEVPTRGLVL